MDMKNLRKLEPHLRHGALNQKCLEHLYQVGSTIMRRVRHIYVGNPILSGELV